VVTAGGGPAARPLVFAAAPAALSPFVQECAEEWVIKFVASAPDANE
jgi:hypothetical protein